MHASFLAVLIINFKKVFEDVKTFSGNLQAGKSQKSINVSSTFSFWLETFFFHKLLKVLSFHDKSKYHFSVLLFHRNYILTSADSKSKTLGTDSPWKKRGNLGFKKSKWAKLFIKDFEIIIHLFVSRSLKSKVALKIQS